MTSKQVLIVIYSLLNCILDQYLLEGESILIVITCIFLMPYELDFEMFPSCIGWMKHQQTKNLYTASRII